MSAAVDHIRNARAKLMFAADSLAEHAGDVVRRSRAAIEAMAVYAARQMELPTPDRRA